LSFFRILLIYDINSLSVTNSGNLLLRRLNHVPKHSTYANVYNIWYFAPIFDLFLMWIIVVGSDD